MQDLLREGTIFKSSTLSKQLSGIIKFISAITDVLFFTKEFVFYCFCLYTFHITENSIKQYMEKHTIKCSINFNGFCKSVVLVPIIILLKNISIISEYSCLLASFYKDMSNLHHRYVKLEYEPLEFQIYVAVYLHRI